MRIITLTDDEKTQLLSVLSELDPDAPPDRRTHSRHNASGDICLYTIAAQKIKRLQASLINVSANGLGFSAFKELKKDSKVIIRVRFIEGGGSLILAVIRNCRSLNNGLFQVGVQFSEKVEDPRGDTMPPMDWVL